MVSRDDFQGLVLKGVTPLDRDELGRGAYGRVYAVNYYGTICAAKEIHSVLVEGVGQAQMQLTLESFMRECRQCSVLRHPNIIQFLGVYYPPVAGAGRRMRLPVMVMEMMADSLTSLVDKHEKIPVHIKFSIVHDVSLGLCYLHNHDPPIIHRDLSPNNILLTGHHVAKISDLGVAKVIRADCRKTMTKAPGTVDFMPPECLSISPIYGIPMDVFSFAGIILHTFNQQWPRPIDQVQFDPKTRRRVALSEVQRRQQYLDKLRGEAVVLRPLVEECLDDDPTMRPMISAICESIQVSKDVCMKEFPQDIITLHHKVKQKDIEVDQLRRENNQKDLDCNQVKLDIEQLKSENDQLRQQLSSIRSVPILQVASQLDKATLGGQGPTTETSNFRVKHQEAPPLIPALTSGRFHIKWTQLADLPFPMHSAYVAVKDKKVYVCGGDSQVEDAEDHVYVYDLNTDHWSLLPCLGRYYGVPHIIGGRLAIIGGCLSCSYEMTNKVSTFDETSQTWLSYYPDLLSVRDRPGVVTHLEYVIVAGGVKGIIEKPVIQDDVEVLNWIENGSHWRKVSINLPVPMATFTPVIVDDHLVIVGYGGADLNTSNDAYKIPVAKLTTAKEHAHPKWINMTKATHWSTVLVPSSSSAVVVGGQIKGVPTSDIKIYDDNGKSWRKIASLSSPRSRVAIALADNNAIIVIGGCTKGDNVDNADSSSLTTVELGQALLIR